MYTLLYSKWITNKDLLYSTWNSIQCDLPAWMGEGFGGEWIHVHVWLFTWNHHNTVNPLCVCMCDPKGCNLPGSSVHGIFPGKNTGAGCYFLLQGIFPTQGLNPRLLLGRQMILYHWATWESYTLIITLAYGFRQLDIVAAEIVSDQVLAYFPWGKGKIAPVIMKRWRGEARFTLAFLAGHV